MWEPAPLHKWYKVKVCKHEKVRKPLHTKAFIFFNAEGHNANHRDNKTDSIHLNMVYNIVNDIIPSFPENYPTLTSTVCQQVKTIKAHVKSTIYYKPFSIILFTGMVP